MEAIWNWLQVNLLSWLAPPKSIQVIDIIQIALLAIFVYRMILWLKNTRAYALLKGILVILVFVFIVNILHMEIISWLIQNVTGIAITAIIIIFQPELRRVLEQMGHSNPLTNWFSSKSDRENLYFNDKTINEITRATFNMAESKTGALIVVELDVQLKEFEETGIPVDAQITSQLIENIFEHNTPLHDGALIIRKDRIVAATCYLPLSENTALSKNLGTRHRAGVGVSEISDCITIIVSEETGQVSYAREGRLYTGVNLSDLRETLHQIQSAVKTPKFVRKEVS
ncbi:MAG: diadenylate cyclase CdaA [Eubacterium sp.]|nr:diadenylate cyclase CdaA [Eubacterium sp.]